MKQQLNRLGLWGSEADTGNEESGSDLAAANPRITQLEAALAEERKKVVQKDEEILTMEKMISKLESLLEQQAKDSEMEQGRLSSLEAVLKQNQNTEESEKVKKLLLALSEAKRVKEQAEKTAAEQTSRADRLELKVKELEQQLQNSGSSQVASLDTSASQELCRVRDELADEQQKREEAEVRERMQRAKMEQLEKQLETAEQLRAVDADADIKEQLAEKDRRLEELTKKLEVFRTGSDKQLQRLDDGDVGVLQLKLDDEERRRRECESLAADREGELRHLRQRMQTEDEERLQERATREQQIQSFKDELNDVKKERSEALTKVSAKESQVSQLQKQLAEELSQRQAAQRQLVDKERQLREMKDQPFDRLSKQQAAQEQVIEKEREVCDLQQQLADELSKRQAVQYQIIEKDRVICELQTQISEYQNSLSPGDALSDSGILQPIEEDQSQLASLAAAGADMANGGGTGVWVAPSTPQTSKRLPPWLQSPGIGNRPTQMPIPHRASVPIPSGLSSSDPPPVWVAHSGGSVVHQMSAAGYTPVQPRHSVVRSAAGAGQQFAQSNQFRTRAYAHGISPRGTQHGQVPGHVARRLSHGAATFA
eukprot:gb/GFBE01019372.1/.p1 GENE.gb/GFBE01019372.1/~~gb/GFBE01019372.1/.p1  ORF type:complete len:599 (+),score=162.42 gb/GFBE01019372.1/:1-1797(+)